MLQNTLSFFTVLSLVFTSNIALANDNPWDSWEDFVPEESLITEDNSSSISNTDVSEEKDTFFSYFKVRNAATITEHPSLNWEDSMWTAIKVSYDKGPHEVLPKENYEIRVYLEPKTGSLYFSPQYNSEMIAHHDISQRSPYVDNSDFRLASNDENQWSKNDSNYIVLIPTEDIQRGSPKTVLFRYTAPSQEDFDASILSTQITARIWTKNLDEKGEYTDNKKTTNFEIKNQRNSISIDGNISLPERNFFIVPNTEESTKVESINARLKNNRKFIQQDLTIKGYITNDVIQNTENYFYQTLATQTGVSIDTFQYKNIEFAFTPKLLDHINQQQYFLTLGVFDQSDNKIDEVTLPFEVRRDTVHLQTDWVSFYQYPDYIRGTIRTHNKGARSINDYSWQIYLCTTNFCKCTGDTLDSFNITSMSTSSNLLHSFRLPISHDNYQSIAVQYSGNHQSFCHSTQLDPALWLNAPLKRIKDGDFTIEATPLSLSKVANTPLSWKFDFKDTIGNATDIHKLQADISIKGWADQEFVLIDRNLSLSNASQTSLSHKNIVPRWKSLNTAETDEFILKTDLHDKYGPITSKEFSFIASKPDLPFSIKQTVNQSWTLGQDIPVEFSVGYNKSSVENYQELFYQTDLICGDKQKTVIEKTQIDKAKVMSHGYLHWENTIKNPLTIAQDNCSLTTSLFFNDQYSILKETDTTNNINIQNF